jgi:hypothetical protein
MNWFKKLFFTETEPSVTPATIRPSSMAPEALLPSFPFPLVAIPGATAVDDWQRYQTEWRKEGCSAVLLGDAEDVESHAAAIRSDERSAESILQGASTLSADEFFAQRAREYRENDVDLADGAWPAEQIKPSPLTSHLDLVANRPKPTAYLAKVPTTKPWEIAAHLKFGGWNDASDSERQVMVLKYWHERYGIEIFAMTGDVLECIATRRPASREAALGLAREQFLYCSDIVHQGTGTIALLGATLLASDNWFFWWD